MSNDLNLKYTGNVFVDAGISAITTRFKININEVTVNHLRELSKEIAKLYLTDGWKKNMHSIFPNSVLVNNAVKGDREVVYLKELNFLIDNIPDISYNGNCMACGCRDSLNLFQKKSIPLTGSGSLKNYFSFANDGVDYCPLCALLVQFSPLVMYQSKNFILLHSNSEKVMSYWAKKALKNINKQEVIGEYSGCFNEGFNNPVNAIFQIISNIIFSYDERWVDENPSINFYFFTNYNQNPDLEIFSFPTNVFRFLAYIPADERNNWDNIIKKGYYIKDWSKIKTFDDYKNISNDVYISLLKNKSILRYFYDFKSKKVLCSWNLIQYYLKEVLNMDEKRINIIKELGDKLSVYIKTKDSMKTLNSLENAKYYNTFRNILRKIMKDKIKSQDKDLLFTFDDYVNYLFPEGNKNWKEIQDLLLFRIYEKLQDWLINNENIKEENDEKEDE